jgi:hypothetical protein
MDLVHVTEVSHIRILLRPIPNLSEDLYIIQRPEAWSFSHSNYYPFSGGSTKKIISLTIAICTKNIYALSLKVD